MDIEKLNKTQIILLTLLTSFVTSIATGIVTVTLMDQAPPGVTHTISKVVEHTVEKIVPEKTQGSTVVKTVVVEQKDALAEAVAKEEKSFVLVRHVAAEPETDTIVSVGFVVSDDGLVATDSALVGEGIEYALLLADGTEVLMQVVAQDEGIGIALLAPQYNTGGNEDINKSTSFVPVSFAAQDSLVIGKSMQALTGRDTRSIKTGIITKLVNSTRSVPSDIATSTPAAETYLYAIYTNIALGAADSGSILFDIVGDVAGMNISRNGNSFTVPARSIMELIASYREKNQKEAGQ